MKAKMPMIHQRPSRPRVRLEREGSKSVALWVPGALSADHIFNLRIGSRESGTTFISHLGLKETSKDYWSKFLMDWQCPRATI